MTGKQLKEFASQVHDAAVVEVCDYNYRAFKKEFSIRATLQTTLEWKSGWEEEPKLATTSETSEQDAVEA